MRGFGSLLRRAFHIISVRSSVDRAIRSDRMRAGSIPVGQTKKYTVLLGGIFFDVLDSRENLIKIAKRE